MGGGAWYEAFQGVKATSDTILKASDTEISNLTALVKFGSVPRALEKTATLSFLDFFAYRYLEMLYSFVKSVNTRNLCTFPSSEL